MCNTMSTQQTHVTAFYTSYTIFLGVRANEHEVSSNIKNWSIIYKFALSLHF